MCASADSPADSARPESETRLCPFCAEEVKAAAVKCKHCGSALPLAVPAHQGTCPYCKEAINPKATKCKHCKSFLCEESPGSPCGCGGAAEASHALTAARFPSGPRFGRRDLELPTSNVVGSLPFGCMWYCYENWDGRVFCGYVC